MYTDDVKATPDLKTALNFSWGARDVWFNMGLQLNIGVMKLQQIDDDNDEDTDTCLREMLLEWLTSSPSWEDLATALEQGSVDWTDMACEIRRKFDLPEKPLVASECNVDGLGVQLGNLLCN